MCDLRRHWCRKIETVAQQDLGALTQFGAFRHFVDAELLAANGAFPSPVTQDVQLRAHFAPRAEDVARVVALRGPHFLFELLHKRVCVDNHVWIGSREDLGAEVLLSIRILGTEPETF